MKLIAAADKNWAIGKDGKLLVTYFRRYEELQCNDNRKCYCYGKKDFRKFSGRETSSE